MLYVGSRNREDWSIAHSHYYTVLAARISNVWSFSGLVDPAPVLVAGGGSGGGRAGGWDEFDVATSS